MNTTVLNDAHMIMQNSQHSLFPDIAPYASNFFQPDGLHAVYYEICGNPAGIPVVFLHGGPGSGCNPAQRRFFDPEAYHIILIDQRGCGRSTPQGSVINNTTQDLVADIDAIRQLLNIDQWLVFGGSWGSTLALCYAQTFPQRVSGLILRGIFLSRASELAWFLGEVAQFYPDVWHELISYLPKAEQNNVLEAFSWRVFDENPAVHAPAALAWNAFENAIMRLIAKSAAPQAVMTPEAIATEVARARVQIHYIQHVCFIAGDAVLAQCEALQHIPTVIVQGRYDMVCPPITAWQLSQKMPHAQLLMIADAGHSAMETNVISALVAATEDFKLRLQAT